MAQIQGILGNNVSSYLSLYKTTSLALGVDDSDSGKIKLKVSSAVGALPSGTAQLTIDPSTNGNITLTPNGSGSLKVSYLIAGAVVTDSSGQMSTAQPGTAGHVLTSNGAGTPPSFAALPAGGVTSITGTANQITASASTGAVTLSTPSIFIAPGTIASTTTNAAGTNFLLPATSTTAGQILINSIRYFAQPPSATPSSGLLVGANAGNLTLNAMGDGNTCVGNNAGANIQNGGIQNTCVGQNAGLSVAGNGCTYIGAGAGGANSGGNANDGNTGVGVGAIANPSAGSIDNAALGRNAMGSGANSGAYNVALGANSLQSVTSGSENVSVGRYAMQTSTSLTQCTGLGPQALINLAGAASNTIGIGYQAGSAYTTTESYNIVMNSAGVVGESNVLRIGAGTGTGAKQLNKAFVSGIFGITVGASGVPVVVDNADQLGTVVSSERFKENIKDMGSQSDVLYKLNPVTFNMKSDESKAKGFGLIAEQVEKVIPELVVKDQNGIPLTVKYHELPAMLLNELIKMNKRVEELERQLRIYRNHF